MLSWASGHRLKASSKEICVWGRPLRAGMVGLTEGVTIPLLGTRGRNQMGWQRCRRDLKRQILFRIWGFFSGSRTQRQSKPQWPAAQHAWLPYWHCLFSGYTLCAMGIICDCNIKDAFLCLNPVSTLNLVSNLSFIGHVYPAEYSHPLSP